MKKRISVVCTGMLLAVIAVCAAQQAPATFKRTELQRADLSAAGREVVQAVVDFQPAGAAGRHNHPGEEIGYILEGTIRFELDGQPPAMKKAGDYFFVPAGRTHNATSVGSGTAKVLATYIVEKGKPLATPVP